MTKAQVQILELETELRCARDENARLERLLKRALKVHPTPVPPPITTRNSTAVRPDIDLTATWAESAAGAFDGTAVPLLERMGRHTMAAPFPHNVISAIQSESGMLNHDVDDPPADTVFFGFTPPITPTDNPEA